MVMTNTDQTDSAPHGGMSRGELFSRSVGLVAAGAVWILMVLGIVTVGVALATSPVGQLKVLTMLCIAPVRSALVWLRSIPQSCPPIPALLNSDSFRKA